MENKEEIISNLKNRCKIKLAENQKNKKKMLIYEMISTFLKDGESFFRSCDAEVAINVLIDLGFEKEEAKKLYLKLICP